MLISRAGGCSITLTDLVTLTYDLLTSNEIDDQDLSPGLVLSICQVW